MRNAAKVLRCSSTHVSAVGIVPAAVPNAGVAVGGYTRPLLLYELNYPWDRCNLIPLKPTRLAEHFFHSIRLHSAVAAVIPHPHGCSAEGRYKLHTCTHSTIYMIYYLTSYIKYKGMFLELRALLCLFVFALKLNSSTNLQTLL